MCRGVRLLVVSQDHAVTDLIHDSLEAEGHYALCVGSSEEASTAFNVGAEWDYLVLDVSRRDDYEMLFAPSLLQRIDAHKIYILAENGDSSWKEYAQDRHIDHVLMKPVLRRDLDRMISASPQPKTSSERSDEALGDGSKSWHLEEIDGHGFFLAASPSMMQLYKNIRLLSSVDYPVLILGESGVGKEMVARLLHKYHRRHEKNFINVNTAAIPSELLESELFGYEAGAFTGAVKPKPGKFELADHGTLLLDEIGEMSLQMQAKLLHVLQDGTFSRLGSRSSTQVDVRILAATNVDMESAIAEKRFREDLFYRINAFTLTVPSLRERREEIPLLIEQMLNRGSASAGREPPQLNRSLIEAAQEYHWPGNLRELRNFVTRLLVLQDQHSALEALRAKTRIKATSAEVVSSAAPAAQIEETTHRGMKSMVNTVKHEMECRLIKEALSASGWNRRRAALNLNISYRALLYKIQQHGLVPSR